jgi:uncharacterized membrane protein YphA (DoxX/SURF4 family)
MDISLVFGIRSLVGSTILHAGRPLERPKTKEEKPLQRLYSGFPGGLPGVALAVLRSVIGITVLVQGGLCLAQPDLTPTAWFSGLLTLAAGFLVSIGFLTPIAVAVTVLYAAGVALALLPSPMPSLFDSNLSLVFGLAMLLSIIGIGPGAFSVDARVFGRREIIIPPTA